MVSPAAILGLTASRQGLSPIPCRAPQYLTFHFVFAYVILTARHMKQFLGFDDNVSPRQSIDTVGEEAVRSGKITRRQLDMVKRNDAAQANSVENYTLFVASMLSAQLAGIPNHVINRAALVYTVARIGYAAAYIFIDSWGLSIIRSKMWWVGNFSCLYLLWRSGKALST